jgi:uncharacterized protein YuzE
MRLNYDHAGDILYLQLCLPNDSQRVVETSEGVLVRLNAETGAVEGYEVQGFAARRWEGSALVLPERVAGGVQATA